MSLIETATRIKKFINERIVLKEKAAEYTTLLRTTQEKLENLDSAIKFAREDAVEKVWAYLGFDLATKLNMLNGAGAATGDILRIGTPKTYIGTKVVRAVPYTLKEYNDLRGWDMPEKQDPKQEGYLIEYVDGGPPNLLGFTGYVSWAPKEVFDRSYTTGVEIKPESFVDRLKTEYSQLTERLKKLNSFVGSNAFNSLTYDAQDDLELQAEHMRKYAEILAVRITKLA